MPSKLQVPRISDAIAATLERRILEGSLKPGDRLPPERELAVDLGVSRPSLREAIQKLASKGMVHQPPGRWHLCHRCAGVEFSDPWQDMMGKHPNLREDMLEFRRMLEGQAAEWAAERATDADLQRLEQSFNALMAAFESDDAQKRSDADIAFHQAIGDAAHNVLIGHLSGALLGLMHDNIRLNLGELKSVPAASRLLMSQHESIFRSIREKQTAGCPFRRRNAHRFRPRNPGPDPALGRPPRNGGAPAEYRVFTNS